MKTEQIVYATIQTILIYLYVVFYVFFVCVPIPFRLLGHSINIRNESRFILAPLSHTPNLNQHVFVACHLRSIKHKKKKG